MTLEQKKKALDSYVAADFYTKGSYVDAQDTTSAFIMAKVVHATASDVTVNYDGWSEKWNNAFRKKSFKIAPFRSQALGYAGQTKVAIRNGLEPISLAEIRFVSAYLPSTLLTKFCIFFVLQHISNLEGYITNDFEGKPAHQMS